MSYNYNQVPYAGQQQGYVPPAGPYPLPFQGGYPQGGSPQEFYPPTGGYPTAPQPGFKPLPSNVHGYGGYNPENPEVKGFHFPDQSIRRGLINKVFSILMAQLLISMGFIALFCYHNPTNRFIQYSPIIVPSLFIISFIVTIVVLITLARSGEVRRKSSINFIMLFIFSITLGFLLGVSASIYAPDEVMMAVMITTAVCLALTLFTCQTKYYLTMMVGILLVAAVILLIFCIVAMFFRNKIVQLVYASLGALIVSVYLVYDTQLMIGGKHKYSFLAIIGNVRD